MTGRAQVQASTEIPEKTWFFSERSNISDSKQITPCESSICSGYVRQSQGHLPSTDGHPGFTITELLVVIAVLAVLAALSIPMIDKASASGKAAVCTSNLKQLSAIISAYVADNDGTLPWTTQPVATGGAWVWYSYYNQWGTGSPLTYMAGYRHGGSMTKEEYEKPGAKHIFNCPCNRRRTTGGQLYVGYLPNSHVMSAGPNPQVRMCRVTKPSEVILLADHNADGPNPNPNCWYFGESDWETKIGFHRHSGKANVLFVDGSVRALTAADIDPKRNIKPPEL